MAQDGPSVPHPSSLLRPSRSVVGISAVLLAFDETGEIDRQAFVDHLERTAAAGLIPAINMDTGYAQLLDDATRHELLALAVDHVGEPLVAGAHVQDAPGDTFHLDGYLRQVERIQAAGAVPILFPSHGLNGLEPEEWVAAHERIGRSCERFLAFELGEQFVPYGRIYPVEAYAGLLAVPSCVGAKHSSLRRTEEWARLRLRDEVRADFMVLTGNDLAIDMITYGSDYLLGLSTFDPEAFGVRDQLWAEGDPAFYELNDLLQFLGHFAFRRPTPAYRHSAAQYLQLRGLIASDATPRGAPRREDHDREVLAEIAERVEILRG